MPTTRSGGAGAAEEKEAETANPNTEEVLKWHKAHATVKKVRVVLTSNAAGVSKEHKVLGIEVFLRAKITSTAVIVALPSSSTTTRTTLGIFEDGDSCPANHTAHSIRPSSEEDMERKPC